MSIRGFRLNTGEIVLTGVTKDEAEYFQLESPAEMVIKEIEPGRAGVALQPFVPYGTDVKLYKVSVTAEFTPDQQVANEYNRIYGSGIVIAGANALSGLQM